MVRLPLPMVMVGVLVALAAKRFVKEPPGMLALTAAMSSVLELENKGESWFRVFGRWAFAGTESPDA